MKYNHHEKNSHDFICSTTETSKESLMESVKSISKKYNIPILDIVSFVATDDISDTTGTSTAV